MARIAVVKNTAGNDRDALREAIRAAAEAQAAVEENAVERARQSFARSRGVSRRRLPH
jgi:cellobiose-specific phosphotransferase system component IIA